MTLASLLVIVVEIVVARVSLAFTADVISASQSMLVEVEVPLVVTEVPFDEVELAVDVLLVLELTLVTLLPDPSREVDRAGKTPARYDGRQAWRLSRGA